MKFNTIATCPIFKNLSQEACDHVVKEVKAYKKTYKKGNFLYHMKDINVHLGIVIQGGVIIVQRDFLGKENIYSYVQEGEIFAETYALYPDIPLLVDVIAQEDTTILFMDIQKIKNHKDPILQVVMQNIMMMLAQKNIMLSRKIMHVTPKTIRERLMAYLQDECLKQNTNNIKIPYLQQQLADYLCVDRSALSNEISKCKKEGILKVSHNIWYLNFKI